MRPRKQFAQLKSNPSLVPVEQGNDCSNSGQAIVFLAKNPSGRRSLSFERWYGRNIDSIARTLQSSIEALANTPATSKATIASYFYGAKNLLDFCVLTACASDRALEIDAIDTAFIKEFLGYIGKLHHVGYSSQRAIFTRVKSLLSVLIDCGVIPGDRITFPANPYPNSNKRLKGEQPYSEAERERLIKAIKKDITAIFQGRFEHRMSEALSICLLAICLRTGRNTHPMLELSREALREHPLSPSLKLLVTQKRRAYATQQTVVVNSQESIGREFVVVQMDAVAIYEKVKDLTAPLAEKAPSDIAHYLWLYRSEANRSLGEIKVLSFCTLPPGLSSFTKRHDLRADDGTPLIVNVSRLRKTLADRLWRLSGGDPFAVARVLGNDVRVTDDHYLDVTPELERNWKFMGESLVMDLRGSAGSLPKTENTPVGKCKDPLGAKHSAPMNAKPCIDFLSCFGCRNYVITDDERDLYRLFSFYWFLIRERESLGASRWSKVYGWIVRVIDAQVTIQFDKDLIARVRERARLQPHPYWRTPEVLDAARGAHV